MKKIFLCILLAVSLTACSDSDDSTQQPTAETKGEVPNLVAKAKATVNDGATITISEGALANTKVEIPKDAVIEDIDIEIGYEDTMPAPLSQSATDLGAVQVSKVVIPHVANGGPSTFNHIVKVTIPYDKKIAGTLPPVVVYWDEINNIYRPVAVTAVDKDKALVTFATSHFSKFMAVVVQKLGVSIPGWDTGFRIGTDSILHQNFGSYQYGGHCMAFASMATHYFSMKKPEKLYDFAQDGELEQPLDDELVRSALTYTYALLSSKWGDVVAEVEIPSNADTGLLVWQAMVITNLPVHFSMRSDKGEGGHSVTVFGYDSSNARFLVYDSNFPKDEVTFDWNLLTGFGSYSKGDAYPNSLFDKIGYFSDDTFGSPTQFETIISDWETEKLKDYFSNLSVDDEDGIEHKLDFGSSVIIDVPYQDNVSLNGRFIKPSSSSAKDDYLHVYVNGTLISSTKIDSSGEFSFTLKEKISQKKEIVLMVSQNSRTPFDGFSAFGEFNVQSQGQNFFTNFGFETGDLKGWYSSTRLLSDGSVFTPTKANTVSPGFDSIATDIPTVIVGNYAARINDETSDYHATFVSQKATVPNSGNPEIRFYWAAVLEDPQHEPDEQPYVDVIVRNNTKSIELYHRRFYSSDPKYTGWKEYQGGDWKAIPWQTVVISGLAQYYGDEVELLIEGADCTLGAHGGYVYLDGEE